MPPSPLTPYVYVFVRRDLSELQRAVQSCHACIEAARHLISLCDEHPHLVLCGVKSSSQLEIVISRLQSLGIAFQTFRDSDLGNDITAIATGPVRGDLRRHFRRYQCLQSEGTTS